MQQNEVTPDPRRWRILAVLLTGIFMALIAVSIVNVALPSIQTGLDARDADMQWVLSGYALSFGVVLVAAGRAGDLLGRGGLYMLGMCIYTAGAIAAGLAPNVEMLNTARFIMGIGAGLFNPQGVGMIQQYFQGRERGLAFGYFGTTVGLAVAVGPPLGGLLIRLGGPDLGWRLTMLLNVPIGILAIVLAFLFFPRPYLRRLRRADGTPIGFLRTVRALDPVGALLLGLTVLCLMLPFMESGTSPLVWGLLLAAAVLLWVWVKWEKRMKASSIAPMVDLDIFQLRHFRNGVIIATMWFFGTTSVWVLVAQYFQNGLGHSALVAGLIGLPAALLNAVSANWAGHHLDKGGRKIVIGGIIMSISGLILTVAVIILHSKFGVSEYWTILTLCFVGGAGGLVISPNQALSLRDVPLQYAGAAGAILQTGQRIGTSVGLAVILAIAFAVKNASDWQWGVIAGMLSIATTFLLTLIVAFADLRAPVRSAKLEKLEDEGR
ncbi:MAG: MFS transporter [Corynebacterium sp.]|uniref:MFS transporter n=1 Tax=Corynebacterium sp. TaxID=1720 RepID=UPI0026DD0D01|nr:MFS transporter [Corynebacterium sp.]MDO5029503.1 MFS transporter [Corynebacterium sp.]